MSEPPEGLAWYCAPGWRWDEHITVHIKAAVHPALGACVIYSPVGIDWLGGANWSDAPYRFRALDEEAREVLDLVCLTRALAMQPT